MQPDMIKVAKARINKGDLRVVIVDSFKLVFPTRQ